MKHTTLRRGALPRRTLVTSTVVALIATAGLASGATALETSLRIEGPSANVLGTTIVTVPASGTKAFRDSGGKVMRAPTRSVFAQLIQATRAATVPVSWTYYPSFKSPYVSTIAKVGPKGTKGWNFRLNGKASMKGANALNLTGFADVVWFWGTGKESVLTITEPAAGNPAWDDTDVIHASTAITPITEHAAGTQAWDATPLVSPSQGPVVLLVSKVSPKGVATPAPGATVTYGTQIGITGADGTVTFPAALLGVTVRSRLAGAVSDTTLTCATYDTSPCPVPAQ